jgi:hypothetical protein
METATRWQSCSKNARCATIFPLLHRRVHGTELAHAGLRIAYLAIILLIPFANKISKQCNCIWTNFTRNVGDGNCWTRATCHAVPDTMHISQAKWEKEGQIQLPKISKLVILTEFTKRL